MYEPQYDEDSGGGFLFGLLCGTALGAAVGLMFAPRAGSELRQTLYESTGDIRKKATDAYGQATEQVTNVVAKGRQAMDRGAEAFDSARQSAAGQGSDALGQGRQGQGGGTADFGSANRPNSGVQPS